MSVKGIFNAKTQSRKGLTTLLQTMILESLHHCALALRFFLFTNPANFADTTGTRHAA
jgi:hypothetical protein